MTQRVSLPGGRLGLEPKQVVWGRAAHCYLCSLRKVLAIIYFEEREGAWPLLAPLAMSLARILVHW